MTGMQQTETTPELNVRVLWCAARWVEDVHGTEVLRAIADVAGFQSDDIDETSKWVSTCQVTRFFSAVRELVSSDEEFQAACIHRMRDAYGPLRFVLPATTPSQLIGMMARTMSLVTAVSTCEVISQSYNSSRIRYRSKVPTEETRLLCLSRQAQSAGMPMLFGLPRATIREYACIANGDEFCEYEYGYYTRSRAVPAVLGGMLGVAMAYLVSQIGISEPAVYVTLPLLCGTIGAIYELRRTYRSNLAYGSEMVSAMRALAEQEADARRELVQFHQRQKNWTQLMEEQVAERTRQLQELLAQIERMSEQRSTSVRGVSHDMRNPLFVLRVNIDFLAEELGNSESVELQQMLQDSRNGLADMEKLLVHLVASAKPDGRWVALNPAEMEVAPWGDKIQRRLRALAFGKDIRVSVFKRREAPDVIETDTLIFERIVDNLCSNAAKYTERGSIVVDIDGKPGFLTLKVSDTGRGIEQERIKQIFEPGGTGVGDLAPRSLGVGLSVVVQLMGQLGGKLEVMSKPGQGTTFWAHFPIQLAQSAEVVEAPRSHVKLADVVTIRTSHG